MVVSNLAGPVTSAIATLTVQAGGAGAFTNGSFEADYTGWTTHTGNQGVVTTGATFVASEGTKAVVFNDGQTTAERGAVADVCDHAGPAVCLDVRRRGDVVRESERAADAGDGAGDRDAPVADGVGLAAGDRDRYVAQSFPFVADSAATTLTFQDTSTTTFNVDLLLDNVQVLLPSGPVITGQPQNATVAQNSPASFTVTASGTGLTYQWRLGGVPIGGATGATYAIASAQPSQAGNYDVVVTGGGSVTSAIATLTVHTTPVITGQPQDATVAQNSPASFTVTATGLGLTYQWRLGGVPIGGATGATYAIASAQPSQAGNYDVVVSNLAGPVTSAIATLTVQAGGAGAFTNGSFEADYTGWTTHTGNQGVQTTGATYVASQGSKVVAFNDGQTAPNGVLAQTFATHGEPGVCAELRRRGDVVRESERAADAGDGAGDGPVAVADGVGLPAGEREPLCGAELPVRGRQRRHDPDVPGHVGQHLERRPAAG